MHRLSSVSVPEVVSFCSSPYLPRIYWHHQRVVLASNSKQAPLLLKGAKGSNISSGSLMTECCSLRAVGIQVIEWLPMGVNTLANLIERLGAMGRSGDRHVIFSSTPDRDPTSSTLSSLRNMTRVRSLSFDSESICFEAEMLKDKPSGIVQVETFGCNVGMDGSVSMGLFVDALMVAWTHFAWTKFRTLAHHVFGGHGGAAHEPSWA